MDFTFVRITVTLIILTLQADRNNSVSYYAQVSSSENFALVDCLGSGSRPLLLGLHSAARLVAPS